jgi:Transposase DDE domain group 1
MTECTQELFSFAGAGKRAVVSRFDGGYVVSDGGALLLRQVESRADILGRFAACFADQRDSRRITHSVEQLIKQRVYGLALGYEDLNDHDKLRRDPLLALLSGKTEPTQEALASKSTLNRLELTLPEADVAQQRYKKILLDPESADRLLVDLFLEAYAVPPRSSWIWMRPMIRCTASRRAASFTATTVITAICPYTSLRATTCCALVSARPTRMAVPARSKKSSALLNNSVGTGPRSS